MVEVHGSVADGFEPVRNAFARGFAERGEVGAAVAVYRGGEKVVDLWAGAARADEPDGPAWQPGTAQIMRSATKGPAAACLLLLHQRGQLDLDAPVGTYWPEFKAAGKERAVVRDLLTHRAGVPALDTPLTVEQAVDGVSGPRAVAAQRPQWEPGSDHGYHPHTYGWLLGELVLRATGRTLGSWFAQELARPLGLEMWLGLPPEEEHRVGRIAEVARPEVRGLHVRPKGSVVRAYTDPDSLTRRAFGAVAGPIDENSPRWHAAGLPASGGIGTARALARFHAALIGPADGRGPLFAPATLTAARSAESDGPDRVLVVPTRFGLGFMLHGPSCPMLGPGSFGHPGRGGSLGFADPEAGVGFGYVTAGMQQSVTADPRPQALIRALRGCLA